MRANEFLAELFEPKQQSWEWMFRGSEEATADFNVGEVPYRFHAYSNGENDWEVEFKIRTTDNSRDARQQLKTRFGLTGTGNSTEVMSTVVDIMREFLEMYRGKIDTIGFTAEEPSRQKLYMRMMKRLLPNWDIHTYDSGSGLGFTVVAPENLEEEVLDETTEQDQILVNIADAATKRVIDIFTDKESNFLNSKITFNTDLFMSRKDRLTWLSGIRLKDLYLPQVNDPAINQMLQVVKVKMVDYAKDNHPDAMGSYITYENGSKAIELYVPTIIKGAKIDGHLPANQIRSTFIHEMQHALDDVKSQGKFDSKAGQSQSVAGSEEQQYRQYLKLPYEINARFTQAILDIALQYNKIEGPYRLQDLIKNAFKNHNLDVASNRQYKHLAVRAYKFFDAMQNNPKKIEPKSLAQRALAWITSQPTSVIK